MRGNHLLDEADLHSIGGLEAIQVLVHDSLESFGRFIAHDAIAGEQSVAGGILR